MSKSREGRPFPFVLPPVRDGEPVPLWTGRGFRVGSAHVPLLEYSTNMEGWSDDLTTFHETAAGEDHAIDRESREAAIAALGKYLPPGAPTILEVGSGSGFLLPMLKKRFEGGLVLGSDIVGQPLLELANRHPDIPILRFDLARCPLPDACVDAVVMLNVLEHIEDDLMALQQVRRILKPNGIVVVEVPAGPELYDYYDRHLRHFRRYSMTGLIEICARAGLRVVRSSHLGVLVYPAFWLVKQRNRLFPPRNANDVGKRVYEQISMSRQSSLMTLLIRAEAALRENLKLSYPFGIRCTAVFANRP